MSEIKKAIIPTAHEINEASREEFTGDKGKQEAFRSGVHWAIDGVTDISKEITSLLEENRKLKEQANDNTLLILGNAELRQEIEAKDKELSELKKQNSVFGTTITEQLAEIERLREALENIRLFSDSSSPDKVAVCMSIEYIASAALSAVPSKH